MNKLYVSFVVFLIALSADAQNVFVPKVGLTYNFNSLSFDSYHAKPKVGYMAGFGYNMKMSDHMSFQPEIYYVTKNFDYSVSNTQTAPFTGEITTSKYIDNYRLQYVELALVLKYKIMQEKMYITLAPYISNGVGGKHIYDHTTNYPTGAPVHDEGKENIIFEKQSTSANSNGQIVNHRKDIGLQPGIGYVLPGNLLLEVRYSLGSITMFSGTGARNQTLMLTLSYPLLRKVDEE